MKRTAHIALGSNLGRRGQTLRRAMDMLRQMNLRTDGEEVGSDEPIVATGKTVVVIGGGETGGDCVDTAVLQGAEKVYPLEILPRPADLREQRANDANCVHRHWSVKATGFESDNGRVSAVVYTACRP